MAEMGQLQTKQLEKQNVYSRRRDNAKDSTVCQLVPIYFLHIYPLPVQYVTKQHKGSRVQHLETQWAEFRCDFYLSI